MVRNRSKLMAIAMVAMMLMSGFVMMADGMDGAANDSEGFEEQELLLDGEEPMLLGDSRATGVLEGMYPGSWTWDRTTGIGPYNSFYGAFDIDDGNTFVGVLDPYDLQQLVDGTELSADGHYNIMWVLPTVYWSVDANGNLELSNDPTQGTAYAHTIDGHVYKYVAYGVYEGTPNDDGTAPTALTSESGKLPMVNMKRANFRTLAQANDVSELGEGAYAMLWNFYMWELYKYISFTTIEDFDCQTTVGNGCSYATVFNPKETGLTDILGPYAGNISSANTATKDSAKLFIENSWGNISEFVDGLIYRSNALYIDSKHSPTDTMSGTNVTAINFTVVSGFPTSISTNENIWGFGESVTDGTATNGLTDYSYTPVSSSSSSVLQAGGNSVIIASSRWNPGLSYSNFQKNTNGVSNDTGSRLAFVFDDDPMTFTPDSYDYLLEYDSTLMTTTSAAISVDGMDPITHDFPTYTVTVASNDTSYGTVDESSVADVTWGTEITVDGDTLTIGETTVTATPTTATEQYSYVFDGWYVGSAALTDGYLIEDDVTITAQFSQHEPVTVTLDLGSGTSSTTELTVFVGEPFGELPTPTPKGGYIFTGWYDPNGNKVTSETIVTETEDFTLTAHYELSDALKPVKALTDFIPILMIAGLIIAIIGTALYLKTRDY